MPRHPRALLLTLPLAASPALAHGGHVADTGAGHTHWVALLVVLGVVAVGIGVWLARQSHAARREASQPTRQPD